MPVLGQYRLSTGMAQGSDEQLAWKLSGMCGGESDQLLAYVEKPEFHRNKLGIETVIYYNFQFSVDVYFYRYLTFNYFLWHTK